MNDHVTQMAAEVGLAGGGEQPGGDVVSSAQRTAFPACANRFPGDWAKQILLMLAGTDQGQAGLRIEAFLHLPGVDGDHDLERIYLTESD